MALVQAGAERGPGMADTFAPHENAGGRPGLAERLTRHRVLVFFVLLPIGLAVMSGWMQPGRSAGWPLALALAYYSAINVGSFLGGYVATRLIGPRLARMRAPYWLILIAGFLAGCHLGVIAAQGFVLTLRAVAADLPGLSPLPQLMGDVDTLFIAIPIWLACNLAAQLLTGGPTYGHPTGYGFLRAGTEESTSGDDALRQAAAAEARLIARLRPAARGALVAMRSEQNYVRVYTERGEDLILASLAGLAAELGASGVQVHRSWWVASAAVTGLRRGPNGQDAVLLTAGLEAPIGRTFRRETLARLARSTEA
jgi:hypothetical protein